MILLPPIFLCEAYAVSADCDRVNYSFASCSAMKRTYKCATQEKRNGYSFAGPIKNRFTLSIPYSDLKLFTGLVLAAFNVCILIRIPVSKTSNEMETMNGAAVMFIL